MPIQTDKVHTSIEFVYESGIAEFGDLEVKYHQTELGPTVSMKFMDEEEWYDMPLGVFTEVTDFLRQRQAIPYKTISSSGNRVPQTGGPPKLAARKTKLPLPRIVARPDLSNINSGQDGQQIDSENEGEPQYEVASVDPIQNLASIMGQQDQISDESEEEAEEQSQDNNEKIQRPVIRSKMSEAEVRAIRGSNEAKKIKRKE